LLHLNPGTNQLSENQTQDCLLDGLITSRQLINVHLLKKLHGVVEPKSLTMMENSDIGS